MQHHKGNIIQSACTVLERIGSMNIYSSGPTSNPRRTASGAPFSTPGLYVPSSPSFNWNSTFLGPSVQEMVERAVGGSIPYDRHNPFGAGPGPAPAAAAATVETAGNTALNEAEILRRARAALKEDWALNDVQIEKRLAMDKLPDDIFIDMNTDIICTICSYRFKLPATIQCGHTFCHACINKWFNTAGLKCPFNCTTKLTRSFVKGLDIQKIINSSKVRCSVNKKCDWIGAFDEVLDHAEICRFREVECPNKPCPERMPFLDMDTHSASCAFKPVACVNCNATVSPAAMKEHLANVCKHTEGSCKACKAVVLRKDLPEHERTCKVVVISCPYAPYGCKAPMFQRHEERKHLEEYAMRHARMLQEMSSNALEFNCTQMVKRDRPFGGWCKLNKRLHAQTKPQVVSRAKGKAGKSGMTDSGKDRDSSTLDLTPMPVYSLEHAGIVYPVTIDDTTVNLILTHTLHPNQDLQICLRILSTSSPARPITMPGQAVLRVFTCNANVKVKQLEYALKDINMRTIYYNHAVSHTIPAADLGNYSSMCISIARK